MASSAGGQTPPESLASAKSPWFSLARRSWRALPRFFFFSPWRQSRTSDGPTWPRRQVEAQRHRFRPDEQSLASVDHRRPGCTFHPRLRRRGRQDKGTALRCASTLESKWQPAEGAWVKTSRTKADQSKTCLLNHAQHIADSLVPLRDSDSGYASCCRWIAAPFASSGVGTPPRNGPCFLPERACSAGMAASASP